MNQQPILAFPNRIDEATLSGGSWFSALPLSNLKDIRYAKKARSANLLTTATLINIDLGRQRQIRLISLIAHNLSELGTWRVTGSDTDPALVSQTINTGIVNSYPAVSSLSLEWEDDGFWFGTVSSERRAYYPNHSVIVLEAPAFARYLKIEIFDTGNPDGYVELGRVFLGPGWSPQVGISPGFNLGHETKTAVEESTGGTEYFDERPLVRVSRFSLDWLSPDEVYGSVFDAERQLGISGEAFYVPFPAEPERITQTAFPCRLRALSPAELPQFGVWRKPFELKERIG